jgi:hypothetical protein
MKIASRPLKFYNSLNILTKILQARSSTEQKLSESTGREDLRNTIRLKQEHCGRGDIHEAKIQVEKLHAKMVSLTSQVRQLEAENATSDVAGC